MSKLKICRRCGMEKHMMSWETMCFQCMKDEELERIQTAVDYEDFPEIYEEGSHKIECPECEQKFELVTSVSYSWETTKLSEKEA